MSRRQKDSAMERTKTISSTRAEEVVSFDQGATMPLALYVRSMRIRKLYKYATLLLGAVAVIASLTPTSLLEQIADLANRSFWVHFKNLSLNGCGEKCHMMAFNVVVPPVTWIATIIVMVIAVPLSIEHFRARSEALKLGFAAFGKSPDGRPKPFPGVASALGGGFLSCVLFFFAQSALYHAAGFNGSSSPGRSFAPSVVTMLFTIVTVSTPFLASAVVGSLTLIVIHAINAFKR